MDVEYEWDGLDEVLGKLGQLEDKVEKKVLRAGVARAARFLKDCLKATVKDLTGLLKKALGTKVSTRRGVVTGIVGPRLGFVDPRDGKEAADKIHFAEFGSVHEPARPWLRPVHDTKGREAVRIMEEHIRAGIEENL